MAFHDDRTQPIRRQPRELPGPTPTAKPEPGPGAKAVGCLLLVVLVVGGFWLLGALFGDDATTPSAPAATVDLEAELETLYLATLQAQDVPIPDRANAIAAGRAVCDAFDDGLDATAFGVSFADASGLTLGQTGSLMGAAVGAFCPEHRGVIEALPGAR